jgi:hypothetical protein
LRIDDRHLQAFDRGAAAYQFGGTRLLWRYRQWMIAGDRLVIE